MSNILASGCERGVANSSTSKLPPATYLNVAYGTDERQVMDIYLPAARTGNTTKVMFLIHGGGWSGGDKIEFSNYIDSLKKRLPDYAFINVNYRLATYAFNKFPTQENDIKAAIDFVKTRSKEYNISHEVVLLGASAGAHLALLQAYKYTDPVKVKAVVSFFGPTDIADMYNNPVNPQVPFLLQLLLGGTPSANPEIYEQASPVHFVTSASCPTLIFQGGRDALVNPDQANTLKTKLQKAGVPHDLVFYPNEGHGWRGSTLNDSFNKIDVFLDKHVK